MKAVVLTLAMATSLYAQTPPSAVTAVVNPPRVCLDPRPDGYLNFDIIIRNGGPTELQVKEIIGWVVDARSTVFERRVINHQLADFLGPGRRIAPSTDAVIYNPFNFNAMRSDRTLRYEVYFADSTSAPLVVNVKAESCVPKTRFIAPVTGRVAIFDGHDVYSHHRRSTYVGRGAQAFGIVDNVGRFGLDLMHIDEQGKHFRGNGKRNEDYFSWGQAIRAPAAGVVAAMHNDQPDNSLIGSENLWTERNLVTNEMSPSGNYVLIDHGNGEFSLAAHVKAGSVRVKKGDRVEAGDVIAEIGNSGSSLGPHLHFELRTGYGVKGIRSLPPYLYDVEVLGTGESGKDRPIQVNTGDVLMVR